MAKTHTFIVFLEPAEEGGYIVSVPSLPEVATCGDTEAEALDMAREAVELVIEHRIARGEPIPGEHEPELRRITVAVTQPYGEASGP